jgi:hypothetical protein
MHHRVGLLQRIIGEQSADSSTAVSTLGKQFNHCAT